ncbi:hypothetical protein RUM44_003964 [Polyplax serrata]|uniref:Uncharacterized protein n=1 Tax=Polyplax serrata TaxID=468196 RepID=A0ABR1B1H3_POLSC
MIKTKLNDSREVKIGAKTRISRVDVSSVNLKVIVVNKLIIPGSRAVPSENPSGARYNKFWFYLSRRVRDRCCHESFIKKTAGKTNGQSFKGASIFYSNDGWSNQVGNISRERNVPEGFRMENHYIIRHSINQ